MRLRNKPAAKGIVDASPFVIHEELPIRGRIREFFPKDRPYAVEIGMGKGRFLIELAMRDPDHNYVGIERYESVLFRGCEQLAAMDAPPDNLRFLCMDARDLDQVFDRDEVDVIYLNFSDPWPKARHAPRRLTSEGFLSRYKAFLKDGGRIEFKTDNTELFAFSLESIEADPDFTVAVCTYDLHRDPDLAQDNIMTEYERKFSALGNRICKLTAYYRADS